MRNVSGLSMLALVVLLGPGCSQASDSNANSAGASATPAVALDKRTGLPVYAGATAGSYSDTPPVSSIYISTDSMQKVSDWYQGVLGADYKETKVAGSVFAFDKLKSDGNNGEHIDITPLDSKTRITLIHYK